MGPLSCPFCPLFDPSPYFLAQHVETVHPEPDEVPFVPRKFLAEDHAVDPKEAATVPDAPSQYLECQCGEAILISEWDDHFQGHTAESADAANDMAEIIGEARFPALEDSIGASATSARLDLAKSMPEATHPVQTKQSKLMKNSRGLYHRDQYTARDWVTRLLGPDASRKKANSANHKDAKRLGVSSSSFRRGSTLTLVWPQTDELGPYAHEDQMPAWLHRQLERGAKVSVVNRITPQGQLVQMESVANEARGVLPVLAQLCEQDDMLAKVYLCHPGVQHVFKMAKEGGFCGYRNCQMLISFIQAARSHGHEYFPARLPSVLDLQELIENAWDRGINTAGKVETGGIRGTRKYIGTPEVGYVPCLATAFDRCLDRCLDRGGGCPGCQTKG